LEQEVGYRFILVTEVTSWNKDQNH
jgi:hypothetical protein